MTLSALDRLEACHEQLIGALDAYDLEAVEAGVAGLREAVEDVRARGGWHDNPEIRERAQRVARLVEAARVRVNFLTDLNRVRIEALETARGRTAAMRYGRSGEIVR